MYHGNHICFHKIFLGKQQTFNSQSFLSFITMWTGVKVTYTGKWDVTAVLFPMHLMEKSVENKQNTSLSMYCSTFFHPLLFQGKQMNCSIKRSPYFKTKGMEKRQIWNRNNYDIESQFLRFEFYISLVVGTVKTASIYHTC